MYCRPFISCKPEQGSQDGNLVSLIDKRNHEQMKQHSQSIVKSSQVPQPVEKAVSLSGSFFNIVVSLDRETHKLVFGQWIFL